MCRVVGQAEGKSKVPQRRSRLPWRKGAESGDKPDGPAGGVEGLPGELAQFERGFEPELGLAWKRLAGKPKAKKVPSCPWSLTTRRRTRR